MIGSTATAPRLLVPVAALLRLSMSRVATAVAVRCSIVCGLVGSVALVEAIAVVVVVERPSSFLRHAGRTCLRRARGAWLK
jgi:hypothetical protein